MYTYLVVVYVPGILNIKRCLLETKLQQLVDSSVDGTPTFLVCAGVLLYLFSTRHKIRIQRNPACFVRERVTSNLSAKAVLL